MKEICLRIIRRCITVAESGDRSMEVEKMKNRTSVGVLTAALGLCLGIVSPAPAATKVWTSDDDWNTGVKSGVVVSAGSVVLELGSGSSNWYNSSWSKRAPITISNASGGDLTDYQVRVDVAYDGDMQSDFDDLRFTAGDGTTEIPYWIESKTDGSNAVVWVKVSSVPTAGATIYMYYGNASATDAGDGFAVFDLFDDFSDLDYSNGTSWTNVNNWGSGSLDASSGELRIYQNSDSGNSAWTGSTTVNGVWQMRFKLGHIGGCSNTRMIWYFMREGSDYYAVRIQNTRNYVKLFSQGGDLASTGYSPGTGWHDLRITRDQNGVFKVYVDEALKVSHTDTALNTSSSTSISGHRDCGYADVHVDDIRVRKYADPEPTTTVGGEESQ